MTITGIFRDVFYALVIIGVIAGVLYHDEKPMLDRHEPNMPALDYDRTLWGFDNNERRWVYEDEIKPDLLKHLKNMGPSQQPYPDAFVEIQGYSSKTQMPRYIWRDGQRYRVTQRADGTLKIEPW